MADLEIALIASTAAASSTADAGANSSRPAPLSAPAMKSSESPGRNGITTTPVSTNTIRNSRA